MKLYEDSIGFHSYHWSLEFPPTLLDIKLLDVKGTLMLFAILPCVDLACSSFILVCLGCYPFETSMRPRVEC